jgi:poly-gamma-glutamate synthesis protein (capsule biosynthesis protein)
VVQTANCASVHTGLIGLKSTLNAIRNAGLTSIGAYSSPQEYQESNGYIICDVQGVKVALVAFSKGVGGRGMPAGNEDCVNLLYNDYASYYKEVNKDKINAILKAVEAEKPDITIAMLHWGSEFNDVISESQEDIATMMKKRGVDVIIGNHPHMVQKIDFDQTNGTLVAYSLGDFYGDATRDGTYYSIILDLEITKDPEMGTTKVTNFTYTPIFTVKDTESPDGFRRVVRIEQAMTAYENNYVDKVSTAAYSNMDKALRRIYERVTGEKFPEETTPTETTVPVS